MHITLLSIEKYPKFKQFWITFFAIKIGDYDERALFEINKDWHRYYLTIFFIHFKF